jgi:hypothetical protein
MKREAIRQEEVEDAGEYEIRGSNWSSAAYMFMIFLGLAFAVYAANILVEQAYDLAVRLNVPHSVVGTTVSGIGTSLPELTHRPDGCKTKQGCCNWNTHRFEHHRPSSIDWNCINDQSARDLKE